MFTNNLEQLRDQAEARERLKVDFPCTPFFNDRAQLVPMDKNTGVGEYEFEMTEWAVQQLCTKLGPGTFGRGSNRMLPKDAVYNWIQQPEFQRGIAYILNANVRRVDRYGATWLVRTYDGTARAILSERYAPVSNAEVLNKTLEALHLLEKQTGRKLDINVVRPFNTPDDLNLKVIIRNMDILVPGERAPFGLGFHIRNNEIGRGGLHCMPTIQVHWCTNSIVVRKDDDATLSVQHRGVPEVLVSRFALAIANCIKLSGEYIEDLLSLRHMEIPDIFGQITKMAEKQGWATEFTDAVRTGMEGEHNAYGLVAGLTYAAHTVFGEDHEQLITWEMLAGDILADPQATLARLGVQTPEFAPVTLDA